MPHLKRQLTKLSPLSIAIIVVFAAAMTYFLFQVFAASGTATLYTSPGGTQSVTNGQSFAVNVRISTGASVPVTGASVYIAYPADKLQVTGQSYGGSPYTTQLIASNAGGVLRMDRAAFPAIAGGDQLFAQVTFKAIATGSAAISFTGSSIVTSGEDDSNILTQKNGVTYNISAPATPPPASSSGGGSSNTPAAATTAASSSASKPATGTHAVSNPKATTGSTSPGTSPDATAADAAEATTDPGAAATTTAAEGGDVTASKASSTIAITILDSKNKPVEGAEVTINGQTAKTDKNGVARFDSIPSGDQRVAVKYNGKQTDKVVHVKGASTSASPEVFKVAIARNKFNPAVLTVPLVVLLAAGVLLLRPWTRFATASAGAGEVDIDKIVASDHAFSTPQTPVSSSKEHPGAVFSPGQQADNPAPDEPVTPESDDPTPPPNTTVEPDSPEPAADSAPEPAQPSEPAEPADESAGLEPEPPEAPVVTPPPTTTVTPTPEPSAAPEPPATPESEAPASSEPPSDEGETPPKP